MTERINIRAAGLIPARATDGSATFDLRADENVSIRPGRGHAVPTGLTLELPRNVVGWVTSRSGLAVRENVVVLNSPGLIDPDYRGEIRVALYNHGKRAFSVQKGDRIAQITFQKIPDVTLVGGERAEFSTTSRGDGGFGSTGVSGANIPYSASSRLSDAVRRSVESTLTSNLEQRAIGSEKVTKALTTLRSVCGTDDVMVKYLNQAARMANISASDELVRAIEAPAARGRVSHSDVLAIVRALGVDHDE